MPDNSVALGLATLAEHLKKSKPSDVDVEAAWRTGNLSYKLWEVQKKMAAVLWSPGSLKKVLNCSRRIRKTSTALTLALELCIKKKNAQVRYVGPTQKMIRKIVHPLIRLLTLDCPSDLKPVWKGQDGLYFFPSSGAELHIAGANNDHEDDSRGTAADLCIVDEAQMIKRLKYLINDVLMPQLITTEGPLWIILTPPKTPVHECRDYVIEAQAEMNSYAEFNIHQSEYPPIAIERFCKEAGGAQSTTWLREYMCQFVVDLNYSIIPEWNDSMIEEYVPDELFQFYLKYEGMDISGGKRHKTSVLYAVYDFRKAKLFVQDETDIEALQSSTKNVADAVKAKEKSLWANPKGGEFKVHQRIADNSNLILLMDLGKEHGLHFAPTSKDTLDAMVNEVRLWTGARKISVSPKCQQLIGSLKYGVWDDKRKHWEESAVYGHFDALAALMYMLRYVDSKFNPVPHDWGVIPDSMHVRPNGKLEGDAKELAKAFGLVKKR